jgi:hypothetical protein
MVTQRELTINGQNPNLPSDGAQSDEKIKCNRLLSVASPCDFNTRPVPIASGKTKKKLRHNAIHLPEMKSVTLLDNIIGGKFLVGK